MEQKEIKNRPKYSLVIPVYNEEKRINQGLKEITSFIKNNNLDCEILLVDDGSTDKTKKLTKLLLRNILHSRLIESNHLGKGGAIKAGVNQSRGRWILFFDIDLATPMDQLVKFEKYQKEYDVIIGSRKMKGANIINRQPFFREFSGKVFTLLTNTIVTKNISDVTCGFKMFKAPLAKKLFNKSKLSDWSFDAEILFLSQKYGYKIKEVPVSWKDDPNTKVTLIKDTIDALLGLLKIRIYDLLGNYS
jgi:dolichyl-phosphate beta-glucosyltransferase